jgi:D-alanine-D-alanine ligase-like ATP-grasp enzyme
MSAQLVDSQKLPKAFDDMSTLPLMDESQLKSIRTLSKAIRDELGGMQLFGFDLVADRDGALFVVDVNYFPGYHHFDEFPQHLLSVLSSFTQ